MYPPAEEYVNHVDKSHTTLVEAFRNMQIEEEEALENGDFDHEVTFAVHVPLLYFFFLGFF